MDFQLKTLDTARAATEKADALVMLVPEAFAPTTGDTLSTILASARKAGDFEAKAGKLLSLYRPEGVSSARAVLAGAGDGSALQQVAAIGIGHGKAPNCDGHQARQPA